MLKGAYDARVLQTNNEKDILYIYSEATNQSLNS